MSRFFIGGLPPECDESELYQLVEEWVGSRGGSSSRATSRGVPSASPSARSPSLNQNMLSLDGHEMGGRNRIRVEAAHQKPRRWPQPDER